MSTNKGLQFLSTVKTFLETTKSFDKCLSKLQLVSGGNGRVVAELKVGPEHLNRLGALHGGCIAMLVDAVSTYALRSWDHIDKGGVSVNMNISYLSSAKEGDNIAIEAVTVKAGRTMAFLQVEVKNKDTSKVIATGSHTKYLA